MYKFVNFATLPAAELIFFKPGVKSDVVLVLHGEEWSRGEVMSMKVSLGLDGLEILDLDHRQVKPFFDPSLENSLDVLGLHCESLRLLVLFIPGKEFCPKTTDQQRGTQVHEIRTTLKT